MKENAGIYSNRGLVLFSKGEFDHAISYFNKALEINPQLAEAYSNRGLALVLKREYDSAISDFNKALTINPQLAEIYSGRGLAWREKGNYHRAISDYNKALEIDPQFVEGYEKINPEYDIAFVNRGVDWGKRVIMTEPYLILVKLWRLIHKGTLLTLTEGLSGYIRATLTAQFLIVIKL